MSVIKLDKSPQCILGEGPHWDNETQSLYYVDVFGKSIHRYVPSEERYYSVDMDEENSIVIPTINSKDEYIVSQTNKLFKITWNGVDRSIEDKKLLTQIDSNDDSFHHRFNDAKADVTGRLWIGTYGWSNKTDSFVQWKGVLCSVEKGNNLEVHLNGISTSNGLDWIDNKFYYIDSLKCVIDEYRFDTEVGKIVFHQVIFTLEKHNVEGVPDGMIADADGCLWVAMVNGGCILRIDPRKPETLMQIVTIPTPVVTSVAFGGTSLDELYVTTGIRNPLSGEIHNDGGYLFKVVDLGTRGIPMRKVKL